MARIYTEDQCLDVNLDSVDDIIDALRFKSCNIKAKADSDIFERAADLLCKMSKYRLHDLRKNPDDLPDDFRNVLVRVRSHAGKVKTGVFVAAHNKRNKVWATILYTFYDDEIIAWREIEPFEECDT